MMQRAVWSAEREVEIEARSLDEDTDQQGQASATSRACAADEIERYAPTLATRLVAERSPAP